MWYSAVGFVVPLTLSLLVAPLTAEAQQPTKVYRIGGLGAGPPLPAPNPSYVEGQNLVREYRDAEGRAERLPALAAELVRLQVDIIVAGGTAAIRAAQHATRTIPIVLAVAYDPVGEGLVASLAQPGENITGLSWLGAALPGKRLAILKETVPQLSRLAA
jgi:putative ABC transport system substrate-binding protein